MSHFLIPFERSSIFPAFLARDACAHRGDFMHNNRHHSRSTNSPRDKHPLETPSEDRQFIEYMRILLTDIAVVLLFLSEIDPAFIVCHDYKLSGEEAEASRIANLVAPNNIIAAMYEEAPCQGRRGYRANWTHLSIYSAHSHKRMLLQQVIENQMPK